jgi:DNA-directed RNA polymerase beta subunit
MHTSANLSYIPFLGSSDQNRLQMSSKQLTQAITSMRCEVPRVIGSDYQQLTNSSRLFRNIAPLPGEIIYSNDDIIICLFQGQKREIPIVYEVPSIMFCAEVYGTKLRYKRDIGKFKPGDILYEYDSFKQGLPTCGYNINTLYAPFFGFNHEDSIVISETIENQCRSTKVETLIIPIYTHSLFKMIYKHPLDFGFIPGIGRKIDGSVVARESKLKSKNPLHALKSMNLTSFVSVIDNGLKFNSFPWTCRCPDSKVEDIRVHRIDKSITLIDNDLQKQIIRLSSRYRQKLININNNVKDILSPTYTKRLLYKHYLLFNSMSRYKLQTKNLAYLIEIKLSGEDKTGLGDKFANRVANKGVCSLILPNELRPYTVDDKIPADIIVGPISVYARMNLGQILEGIVAKAIVKTETQILSNTDDREQISNCVEKLSILANLFGDYNYETAIKELSSQIRNDSRRKNQFIASVKNMGLYFEAPNFTNFKITDLTNIVTDVFNCKINEDVVIPRKTLQFLKQKLNCDIPIPAKDIILKNKFFAPIYTLKLKQEANQRISARDLGSYKRTSRQPVQGKRKGSLISQASKLGQMEFEGLIASGAMRTMKEFRAVKSDSNLKSDLVMQYITTGKYNLPDMTENQSYTKLMIDKYIEFLNS